MFCIRFSSDLLMIPARVAGRSKGLIFKVSSRFFNNLLPKGYLWFSKTWIRGWGSAFPTVSTYEKNVRILRETHEKIYPYNIPGSGVGPVGAPPSFLNHSRSARVTSKSMPSQRRSRRGPHNRHLSLWNPDSSPGAFKIQWKTLNKKQNFAVILSQINNYNYAIKLLEDVLKIRQENVKNVDDESSLPLLSSTLSACYTSRIPSSNQKSVNLMSTPLEQKTYYCQWTDIT